MNCYEIPNLRFSAPAGEAIEQRRFVNIAADGDGEYATAAGYAIGASMNEVANGEVLEIADGIVMVEAGGTIAAGAAVEVGTDGVAVTLVSGVAVGIAITGGALNEIITVKV